MRISVLKSLGLLSPFALGVIMMSCGNNSTQEEHQTDQIREESPVSIAEMSPYIITVEEYNNMAKSGAAYTLIDLRKEDSYKKGHIPGALQIWRNDIQNRDTLYGGLMASKEQMTELLGNLGVNKGETIVVYDDRANVDAMRLWWVLKCYGHNELLMIDGGFKSWTAEGQLIDTMDTSLPDAVSFEFAEVENWDLYASLEDVKKAQEDGILILDTRSKEEYEGPNVKEGAFRAGHIPGALRIDYASNFYYGESEKIRGLDELQYIYQELGDDKDRLIITYCHSGVRSAFSTFVLTELLGYTNVKNYDGSWTEWSYFEELPAETIVE